MAARFRMPGKLKLRIEPAVHVTLEHSAIRKKVKNQKISKCLQFLKQIKKE